MSTDKNSFFLQFQLLLDAYQQRSHTKTSNIVMQQYRCYYCPKEFQTFSETIDHTCIHHQEQKIKIKIVKTSVCLFGYLCLGRSGIVLLKPGVGTGRSLLMHTWVRLIGLRNLHTKRCERHERREETGEKNEIFRLIYPIAGILSNTLKMLVSVCVHCDLFFSSWTIHELS